MSSGRRSGYGSETSQDRVEQTDKAWQTSERSSGSGGGRRSVRTLEKIQDDLNHKPRNSRCEKLSYRIDRILSKRHIQWLLLLSIGGVWVVIGGMAYAGVYRYDPDGECDPRLQSEINRFAEGFWKAWTFMADPGTHSDAFRPQQRVVGAFITLGGILFFACIIAVVVDVTREKMDQLRQDKSQVIEQGHTVVLGWTDKTTLVINELCIAMESEGGGTVVVLANADKMDMEVELGLQLPLSQRLGTKVIFRSGSPLIIGDLMKVSADTAKAVVILAGSGDPDKADAETLRTMLSLRSLSYPLQGFVVAEVRDIDNEPLVKLVGGHCVETLVSHDVLGRLMLMSARQPGLAKVYEALLGFEGDEFYMQEWPELVGVKFGDLMERFPDAVPVGIRHADGGTILKPPSQYLLVEGDRVIVIAEDDDTYVPEQPRDVEVGRPPTAVSDPTSAEKILFCGWRRDIRDILLYLDHLVCDGTEVHMMTHCVPVDQRDDKLREEGLDLTTLKHLKLVHHAGNTSVRRKLEMLPIQSYNSCMIFADQAFEADSMHADSHSLATLLLIRDIQACRRAEQLISTDPSSPKCKSMPFLARSFTNMRIEMTTQMQECPIVCEILDPRTQRTISGNKHVSLASDFCQTNKLIAQIVAMIAEERSVKLLLDELLGVHGCNINVVPATKYVCPGEKVSFYTLAKRALQFDELAFGHQIQHSNDRTELNPLYKDRAQAWDNCDIPILQGEGKVYRSAEDPDADVNKTLDVFGDMEARQALREDVRESRVVQNSEELGARRHREADRADGLSPGPPKADGASTGTTGQDRTKGTPSLAASGSLQDLGAIHEAAPASGSGLAKGHFALFAQRLPDILMDLNGTVVNEDLTGFQSACGGMPDDDRTRLAQALRMLSDAVTGSSDKAQALQQNRAPRRSSETEGSERDADGLQSV